MPERYLMDTAFVVALINPQDSYHEQAQEYAACLQTDEIWVHEAILVEIGNGLSAPKHRGAAAAFIAGCYTAKNTHIVTVDAALFQSALQLYSARPDKEWGLTDCISFVVMQQNGITDALTTDHHFEQGGFRALLRQNA
jgi:hypothetical protein